MKYRYYWLIVFLFFFIACEDFFIKDKEFSMKVTPYTGNDLRIDGYFYKNYTDDKVDFLMFYSNGVFFKNSSTSVELESRLQDPNYIKNLRDCRFCWGPYNINNNILRFEFYDIFGHTWHTCIANCVILNDTTFNIENITFSSTGKKVDVKKEGSSYYSLGVYHFKQFSPKPDSTNVYIR